jgi:hypothetical protein
MTTSRRDFLVFVASGAAGLDLPEAMRALRMDVTWHDVRDTVIR